MVACGCWRRLVLVWRWAAILALQAPRSTNLILLLCKTRKETNGQLSTYPKGYISLLPPLPPCLPLSLSCPPLPLFHRFPCLFSPHSFSCPCPMGLHVAFQAHSVSTISHVKCALDRPENLLSKEESFPGIVLKLLKKCADCSFRANNCLVFLGMTNWTTIPPNTSPVTLLHSDMIVPGKSLPWRGNTIWASGWKAKFKVVSYGWIHQWNLRFGFGPCFWLHTCWN